MIKRLIVLLILLISGIQLNASQARIIEREEFTSKELDEETNLYYYGARYYDGQVSRWMSVDPALGSYLPTGDKEKNKKLAGLGGVFNPVNLALNHYAGNNPLKYTDPNGLSLWKQVPGIKDWWYRFDQSAGGKDPAHYHFGKGKDPNSNKFVQYARRVYIDKDGNINQNQHGDGSKGGKNQDVPDDVIESVKDNKNNINKNDITDVKVKDTWFGFGKEEKFQDSANLDPEAALYYGFSKNLSGITGHFQYFRDKETGDVRGYNLFFMQNGEIVYPNSLYMAPMFESMPSFRFSPRFMPQLAPVY